MSSREPNPGESPPAEPLTRREQEILALLAQGHSGPEIALKLNLARSSVKWYQQQLYAKLGVNSKQQAILRAQALGLLAAPGDTAEAKADGGPPPAPKHNLPLQVTRFFGREAEIGQLKTRLTEYRLVTLVGSGGVGKTRLSLRVAEEVLGDFTDGVWFVELAPLSDPALVPQQVATSLGLRDEPGRPILETLLTYLRDRQALLVLDNCEHLLEASARLADALLHACPRVRLLVSSREALGVGGEAAFPVPSLPYPDPNHLPPAESLAANVALRLFVDRARLVLPDYELAAGSAPAVARICQRLDGIPLAIEMAAARTNIFTAEQLAGRLDDAFRLLTGGSRTALPRQQTLRETLDWSYKLLSDAERLLLQRLAVFAGGCTFEAAEAVCSGAGLEIGQMLEGLAGLVAKSMVLADRPPGAETRYRLLETVRQYAREKLQDSGEVARLRTRHRDYFLILADAAANAAGPAAYTKQVKKLAVDVDNVRLALEWSFSDESVLDAAPRLALGCLFAWPSYAETIVWAKRAVAWCQDKPQIPARLFADLLATASAPFSQDEPLAAVAWIKQAIEISRGLGSDGTKLLIDSLLRLALSYLILSDAEGALAPMREAEVLMLEPGFTLIDPKERLRIMAELAQNKAGIAMLQGRYLEAKDQASAAVRLAQEAGEDFITGKALIDLATARSHLGEFDQAREDVLRALDLHSELTGYIGQNSQAYLTHLLGKVDCRQGHLERAADYCQESMALAIAIPDYNIIAFNIGLAAGIAAKRGQRQRAAKLTGSAQALYARQHRKLPHNETLDTLLPGWRASPDMAEISATFEAGLLMNADQAMAYALGGDAG